MSEKQRSSTVLIPLCAAAGSLVAIGTAGVLPAAGLATGVGFGWLIGQRLRGAQQPPRAREDEVESSSDDETDEEAEQADRERGEDFAAEYLGVFLHHLESQGLSATNGTGRAGRNSDVEAIEKGLHEVFRQLPRERLEQIFKMYDRKPGEVIPGQAGQMVELIKEVESLLPKEAAEAMARVNNTFLPGGNPQSPALK
eukprot:TRINITY_DN21986_c0_g1_i1.p1 TRINITY_DN21986_c0_g1~~TRINITY_DN21986_c0_g1_i1.p1  ORF type:complete len:198 (-),score=51.97 TRINITY_DN21986_c0_g1_i1:143-736(-)